MGTNARLFWVLAGFFFLADAVYITWSLLVTATPSNQVLAPRVEWVGAVGIGLAGVLSVLIGFYLTRLHRSQPAELPEDRTDALIEDGAGEQGHFSPWSWWPLMLAGSLALLFLGVAVGPWISFIGGPLLIIALVGWVYEYYRGYFAR